MSQDGESSENKGFKVVDRRRFTEEGEERSDAEPTEVSAPTATAAPAASSAEPAPAPAPAPAADGVAGEEEEEGIPFMAFVQSLAQQAMMQLGMMPWPHTNQKELQLEGARDTIDILALLKAKTKGNLKDEESQLLDAAIYELRMAWVEISKQIAARAKAGLDVEPKG